MDEWTSNLPLVQHAIRNNCFHPLENLVGIMNEGIVQSTPDSFEQQVARNPDRIAVKTKNHSFTYDQLNKAANRVANAILAHCGRGQESVGLLLESSPMVNLPRPRGKVVQYKCAECGRGHEYMQFTKARKYCPGGACRTAAYRRRKTKMRYAIA